jgi:hypothetical protein
VTILEAAAYGDYSSLVERVCDGTAYEGGPIQFRGNVIVDERFHQIEIRLEVRNGECWLMWEIESLGWLDEKKIDQNKPADIYECDHGMKSKDCVEFGGTWEIDEQTKLVIGMPETLDLQDLIDCGGCRCMCRCLCISIWKRNPDETIELQGQNEVVCAEVSRAMIPFCDDEEVPGPRSASWFSNGWTFQLDGGSEAWPDVATVLAGTEQDYTPCSLENLMMFIDDREHVIEAAGGSVQVEYELNIQDRTPLRLVWGGRSFDEDSLVTFEVYDWASSSWDLLGSVGGRAAGEPTDRTFRHDLDPEHADSNGDIRIRIIAVDCTELRTDQLKVITTRCCKIVPIPPYGVEFATPPAPLNLADIGQCPSPFKFWQLLDTSGVEWYISLECRWCGGSCGSQAVGCCPNPVPRTLFAEVQLGCTGCASSAFTVPIVAVSPFIWEGDITFCGSVFTVRFDCDTIFIEGAGACSFTGNPTDVSCEPFQASYSGLFGGGIGCCGVGSTDTEVPISVTVVE